MSRKRRCLCAKIQHLEAVCNTYREKCCNKLMGEKVPTVEGERTVRRSRLARLIQSDDSRHPNGRLGSSDWMSLVNRPAKLVLSPSTPMVSLLIFLFFLLQLLILSPSAEYSSFSFCSFLFLMKRALNASFLMNSCFFYSKSINFKVNL